MFCSECGSKIPDNSRFCPECGAQLPELLSKAKSQNGQSADGDRVLTPEEKQKIKKRNIIILAALGAVFVVCIIVLIVSLSITPTVNLNKYVKVRFEGYNMNGNAYYDFDYDQFVKDYGKKIGAKKLKNNPEEAKAAAMARDKYNRSAAELFIKDNVNFFFDVVQRADPEGYAYNLSNGDVVILKCECRDKEVLEEYGYKFKFDPVTITVSGLEELPEYDW